MSIYLQITGNITDPQHKIINDDHATRFRLAHTPRVKTTEGWDDGETSWFTIECWGKLAEHVADRLRKGSRVTVTSTRPPLARGWVNDDGEIRTDLTVIAADVALSMVFDQQTR